MYQHLTSTSTSTNSIQLEKYNINKRKILLGLIVSTVIMLWALITIFFFLVEELKGIDLNLAIITTGLFLINVMLYTYNKLETNQKAVLVFGFLNMRIIVGSKIEKIFPYEWIEIEPFTDNIIKNKRTLACWVRTKDFTCLIGTKRAIDQLQKLRETKSITKYMIHSDEEWYRLEQNLKVLTLQKSKKIEQKYEVLY